MPPSNGIVHTGTPDGSGNREHLVLEEMRAKVLIIDVAARVTLEQVYRNPLNTATSRAVYYFPVPASGAVCAFEMRTSDDRIVKAACKEKTQAREEYEQALSQGQETSLLEWVADDIFAISLGSIPANSTLSTKLVFTMTLVNDDNADEIRFQLPMCVGERYGPPLTALDGAAAPSASTRIRITADIQTSGRIQSITSPSHFDSITETKYPTHLDRPSRRRSTIRYRSTNYLDQDFVLVVRAEDLDAPRCFAELQHDPEGKHSDTVAMQFTIVPNFKLPPVAGQEYIFLVDRSGSMGGSRIETAKRTLELLLRMLPSRDSKFNIFSFGSHCDSLWSHSQVYNQNTLSAATAHVTSMSAGYGGTEIRGAFDAVFRSRNTFVSTAVFALTDGEVTDINGTVADIQTAVSNSHAAGSHAHLRVFCLGIGDGVSTAMCEGIARAGNGVCLSAVHTESILGKCARLFRAGRTPFVENVSIDWGIPDENLSLRSQTVNFSTPSSRMRLRPAPVVQQSPAYISDIHAGTRMNVYAILTLRKTMVPKEVTLRGQIANGDGDAFELTVPIRGIQLANSEPGLPLVHTLAAWRLIQDHQERTAPLALAVGDASDEEIRKASIIRLGERYQVASQYTSFVAVDSGQDTQRRARRAPSPIDTSRDVQRQAPLSALQRIFNRFFNTSPDVSLTTAGPDLPGAWPDGNSTADLDRDDPDEGYQSAATFSTLSSLEGSSESELSDWSDAPPPPVSEEDARMQRSPSPKLEPLRLAPQPIREQRRQRIQQAAPEPRAPPPPVHPEVVELAALQLFDGSFDNSIRRLIGPQIFDDAQQEDVAVWATALSIAFMSKHLQNPAQKDLLDDLLEKAYEFLGGKQNSGVKRIIQRAKALL
ncbi:hypothetical protein C8F04DRAFT_1139174 [Mycena alexandri]|uniref:Uncharacterized protein n=1 Tax=Mycena alexandri TaxID=1745969 RepID=A0AAD6S918_9AGAR|nr:hypothetical protein C8F04DRAFT_1139174 [Mycena alexandri]